jgi:hypothetical protein
VHGGGLRRFTGNDGSVKLRLPLTILGAILLVQLVSIIITPKNVSWDPSYGLMAAQQYIAGRSASIFTLAEAEPAQITQISPHPVPYWAPLYQAVPYVLRFGVFDWGVALKMTLGLVLIIGSIGWFVYFAQVLGSVGLALWLSAIVALTRFRWTMALTYDGGDQLIWGASPWVLIIAAAALRVAKKHSTCAAALSAMAGATGASLFALKYSGIFVVIGAGVVFGLICLQHRFWRRILFAGVGFLTVIGAILWAGFPQATTVAVSTHEQMNILRATASFGLPAIGVTDLDRILRAILANNSLNGEFIPAFIGVGLSLVMIVGLVTFVASRSAPLIIGDRVLVYLVIGAVIADLLIMFVLILSGSNVSLDGRFGRVSGLLLLPIFVIVWRAMLRAHRSIWPAFAVMTALTVLILPTTLGTARQLPNLIDRLEHAASETDLEGVVNPYLTPRTNVQAFYAEIKSIAPNSVLYTIYPQMAFPLPQRPLILVEAEEDETQASLSSRLYHGRPISGVVLLLPVWFEHNGKLQAIEASFVDIHQFVRHELLTDPKWALWVGR